MSARDGTNEGSAQPKLRWLRPGRILRDLNIIALLGLVAAAAGLFMSPRSDDVLLGLPDLSLGDRSPRTIRSPRALTIKDPKNTRELRDEAARKVAPVFDQEVWLIDSAEDRVASAFKLLADRDQNADAGVPDDAGELRETFADLLPLVLERSTIDALMNGRPDEMRDAVLSVLSIGQRPIVAQARDLPVGVERLTVLQLSQDERSVREVDIDDLSTILTVDQARAMVDAVAAERLEHLPRRQRRAVAVLAKELLEDNLFRNASETRRRRRLARESVKAVVIAIAPGEVVVKKGVEVDEQKLRILRGMAAELKATSRGQVSAGSILLVMLLLTFVYGAGMRGISSDEPGARDLALLSSAVLLTLLGLWAGYHSVTYLIDYIPWLGVNSLRMALPVTFTVLVVRWVAGASAAGLFCPLVAVIAGWLMDASLPFAAYALAGGLAAASSASGPTFFRALAGATCRIFFAQALVAVAFDMLDSSFDVYLIAERLAAAAISAVGAALLATMTVMVIEALFGYATSLRLGQLANLNHPLLKQMLVEAPGTYHHSIMVGSMAEAAAREINAQPLLAQVGGYYHDIGKLKNPRAFDENEVREVDSADTIAMANELREHVEHGIALANQHRLGDAVVDVIRQHHGTAQVRRRAYPTGPETDKLSYSGPKPMSREAGLVMLADCVEASTRHFDRELVVERPRVERAVAEAVQLVVQDGQLDECPLSLRDLERARRVFVDALEARIARRGRPLSSLPEVTGAPLVRAPSGEPN